MIEISLGKLVLLALIALIVLGPEKLPGAARTAGALLRRLRGGWDNVRAEVERELEIEEIKRVARATAAQAEATQAELKDGLQQVQASVADVATSLQLKSTMQPARVDAPLAAAEDAATMTVAPPEVAVADDALADGAQASLPLGEPPLPPDESLPHGHS
ncbi:MAG: Sec-independent protein translocase protein TatB [Rhodanobacter sp.]